ncbi:MAG: hypothetical protein HY900_32015 [Deltaproteobacteria bacterium]|nr:hypothetical protein [Deltaproteobacteria bacterium]
MKTPKHSLFKNDGKVLIALFWMTLAAFVVGVVTTYVGSKRANPVMLDLQTGQPVAKKPSL